MSYSIVGGVIIAVEAPNDTAELLRSFREEVASQSGRFFYMRKLRVRRGVQKRGGFMPISKDPSFSCIM